MKKTLVVLSAILLLAACSQEELGTPFYARQEVSISAALSSGNNNGGKKRISGKDNGDRIDLTWDTGDQVLVRVGDKSAVFTLSSGEGTNNATFKGIMPADGTSYSVSYPVGYSDDRLKVQPYVENGFSKGLMKMSTKTNCTIDNGFVLSADNALLGLQLAGDVIISKIVVTNKENKKTYTLDCSAHEVRATDGRVFYIVLPAGEWKNGMKVEIYNADGDLIEVKEKNTVAFSANNAMIMPKVEIVINTTKIYCYHLTDKQFEQANTRWNTPNMGWGILNQSPIQGRILHGIRIKVATIGSIGLYIVPSLTESTEVNFQPAATISTSKTGLQDIDFEHPFYLEKDMYLAIGRHSDNVSLVGYYNGDSQSNIQPFCNRIGQSGGITSTQSLMIDFY